MAATAPPDLASEVFELKKRIEQMESVRSSVTSLPTPRTEVKIPTWLGLVNIATICTLIFAIVTFAYYLGALHNTVTSTALDLQKLRGDVTGTSRDSVASRLSVVETKLDEVSKKLDGPRQ